MVLPGLAAALVGAIGVLTDRPSQVPAWAPLCELGFVVVVGVSTATLQGPEHVQLAGGFDDAIHTRLVRSNWIRVAAWSAAGLVSLWVSGRAFA